MTNFRHRGFLRFGLISNLLILLAQPANGQIALPPAGDSGILQKSVPKSQKDYRTPEKTPADFDQKKVRPPRESLRDISFLVQKIEVSGNEEISTSELKQYFPTRLPRKMSLKDLKIIASKISKHYLKAGYILSWAYIPPQKVKNGIVLIRVQEGRLSKITLRKNKKFSAKEYALWFEDAYRESSLKESSLEKALMELNDIQGIQVKSFLKPGEKPGTSNLLVEVEETRPYLFSFDADNFGSRFSGRNRFGITASTGSLFKLGDRLALRAVRSNQKQNFINPSYSIPINHKGTDLLFSYIYSDNQLGGNLAPLNAGGDSTVISLALTHPLYRSRRAEFFVNGGLDFRFFRNYALGSLISDDELADVFLGISGNYIDNLKGKTFFNIRLQSGFREGDISDPLNSRLQGRGNAFIFSGDVSRFQSAFFLESYFILRASGQASSKRLLSPDLVAAGGMGTVRGFPLVEIAGDDGYLLSLQYVLPFPLKSKFPFTNMALNKLISFHGFIDNGKVFIKQPFAGERDRELTGVGGGVRITIPRKKDGLIGTIFNFSYGVPVLNSPQTSDGSDGILYFSGALNF